MIAANTASDWAQIAVTMLLGLVTAYIGLSIRQKRRQEIAVNVADHRLDAYAALWSKIPLSPELRKLRSEEPLKPNECREIFDQLTAWYYGDGCGMMLGASTRSIYLTIKTNLICNPDQFVPTSCSDAVRKSDDARSEAVIRQLSLLRSAMRADLEVYGKPWGKPLQPVDREFLYACRVPGWRVQRTLAERRRWLVDQLSRRDPPGTVPAARTGGRASRARCKSRGSSALIRLPTLTGHSARRIGVDVNQSAAANNRGPARW